MIHYNLFLSVETCIGSGNPILPNSRFGRVGLTLIIFIANRVRIGFNLNVWDSVLFRLRLWLFRIGVGLTGIFKWKSWIYFKCTYSPTRARPYYVADCHHFLHLAKLFQNKFLLNVSVNLTVKQCLLKDTLFICELLRTLIS